MKLCCKRCFGPKQNCNRRRQLTCSRSAIKITCARCLCRSNRVKLISKIAWRSSFGVSKKRFKYSIVEHRMHYRVLTTNWYAIGCCGVIVVTSLQIATNVIRDVWHVVRSFVAEYSTSTYYTRCKHDCAPHAYTWASCCFVSSLASTLTLSSSLADKTWQLHYVVVAVVLTIFSNEWLLEGKHDTWFNQILRTEGLEVERNNTA